MIEKRMNPGNPVILRIKVQTKKSPSPWERGWGEAF
jgi:hypothetical protein